MKSSRLPTKPQISIVYYKSKNKNYVNKWFRLNVKFLQIAEAMGTKGVKIYVDKENHLIGFQLFKYRTKDTIPVSINRGKHLSVSASSLKDYDFFKNIHERHKRERKFFPYRHTDYETGKDIWVIEIDKPDMPGI